MKGSELKERRNKLKMSQEKLAQSLGVTSGSVARWEQLKDEDIPSPMLDLAIEGLERRQKDQTADSAT